MPLFHVYIGTAYQGPVHANNAEHACRICARNKKMNWILFNAKPAISVQEMKKPKPKEKA